MDFVSLLKEVAAHNGSMGVICVILMIALYYKDKELRAVEKARIDDAKSGLDLALKIKSDDVESKHRIESLLDELERRS